MSRTKIDGFLLLALAAICLWLPSHWKQPGIAHHKILVASEKLQDGIFNGTVILVLQHDAFSATGLVLNKPAPKQGEAGFGGPVETHRSYSLHSLEGAGAETTALPDLQIGYTKNVTTAQQKFKEALLLKGYAGWGLGQLSREIDKGSWKVIDFDYKLVFRTAPQKMWQEAARRPATLSGGR